MMNIEKSIGRNEFADEICTILSTNLNDVNVREKIYQHCLKEKDRHDNEKRHFTKLMQKESIQS